MLLPRFIKVSMQDATLISFDNSAQSPAFSAVRTFADSILNLVKESGSRNPKNTVVNFGNPRFTSILDLAKLILRQTASASSIQFILCETEFYELRNTRGRLLDCRRRECLTGRPAWPKLGSIAAECVRNQRSRLYASSNVMESHSLASGSGRWFTRTTS